MVQTIKRLILKSKDPYLALLAYRATPGILGPSPAEILMGRRLRTRVPMAPQLRGPVQPPLRNLAAKDSANKKLQARYYNRRHRTRELNKLKAGDSVWVTDMKTRATVLATAATPRSYIIRTQDGSTLRRNRRMLNHLPEQRKAEGSYEFPNESDSSELVFTNRESPATLTDSLPLASGAMTSTLVPSASVTVTKSGRVVKRPVRYGIDE